MPVLIYSIKPNEPSLVERHTEDLFGKLYPSEKIGFSNTMATTDLSGKHTLVVGGGNLIFMLDNMKDHSVRENCLNALDSSSADYMGFCAGAYYGAQKCIPGKNALFPLAAFEKGKPERIAESFGEMLGVIENSCAVGPIKPHKDAESADVMQIGMHAATLEDHQGETFDTLYMEGPMFFDRDFNLPYPVQDNVVANYVFDYDYSIHKYNGIIRYGKQPESTVTLPRKMPAVLHEEKKGSHRYLFGPHPELASTVRTFVPALELAFRQEMLARLSEDDKSKLMTKETEERNRSFISSVFKK